MNVSVGDYTVCNNCQYFRCFGFGNLGRDRRCTRPGASEQGLQATQEQIQLPESMLEHIGAGNNGHLVKASRYFLLKWQRCHCICSMWVRIRSSGRGSKCNSVGSEDGRFRITDFK